MWECVFQLIFDVYMDCNTLTTLGTSSEQTSCSIFGYVTLAALITLMHSVHTTVIAVCVFCSC